MSVSPIEYRYGRSQVKKIFSENERYIYMTKVESAAMEAQAEFGLIPMEAAEAIKKVVDSRNISLDRIKQVEKETKHDIMSMIKVLTEMSPEGGKYLHLGLTSNDIIDTAQALQLRDFMKFLLPDFTELLQTLSVLVMKYRKLPMMGRTHGQHASPVTLGLKFSVFLAEFNRHATRIIEARERFLVGKLLGPVGTGASIGRNALRIQKRCMEILGLGVESNPTQITGRDRIIEYLSIINNIATTLEKLATEIRNLQRPEIGELSEAFDEDKQVGSSAMPSKRNPITCENVTSLSRLIRAFIVPEYEAAVTWHERDLTNTALERFTVPYSSILIDDILQKMIRILKTLEIHEGRIRENLRSDYLAMSESVVTHLAFSGVPRQQAHEIVREASMKTSNKNDFISFIVSETGDSVTPQLIKEALRPSSFIGVSSRICGMTITSTKKISKKLDKIMAELE
ncbi:MAG: adenylosuccinate lyase [Thermoplasmataceae archaeon]|jgi:adenylosuccinate lyase